MKFSFLLVKTTSKNENRTPQALGVTKLMKICANINQMNSLQCGNRVLGAHTTIIEAAHSVFNLLGELLTKLKILVLSS